jgi:hypothetical protein
MGDAAKCKHMSSAESSWGVKADYRLPGQYMALPGAIGAITGVVASGEGTSQFCHRHIYSFHWNKPCPIWDRWFDSCALKFRAYLILSGNERGESSLRELKCLRNPAIKAILVIYLRSSDSMSLHNTRPNPPSSDDAFQINLRADTLLRLCCQLYGQGPFQQPRSGAT